MTMTQTRSLWSTLGVAAALMVPTARAVAAAVDLR